MEKEKIIKLAKSLRKETNRLCKFYNNNTIHISFSLEAITGEIMSVNPFGINLRKGIFFGRDLKNGEYKNVRFW